MFIVRHQDSDDSGTEVLVLKDKEQVWYSGDIKTGTLTPTGWNNGELVDGQEYSIPMGDGPQKEFMYPEDTIPVGDPQPPGGRSLVLGLDYELEFRLELREKNGVKYLYVPPMALRISEEKGGWVPSGEYERKQYQSNPPYYVYPAPDDQTEPPPTITCGGESGWWKYQGDDLDVPPQSQSIDDISLNPISTIVFNRQKGELSVTSGKWVFLSHRSHKHPGLDKEVRLLSRSVGPWDAPSGRMLLVSENKVAECTLREVGSKESTLALMNRIPHRVSAPLSVSPGESSPKGALPVFPVVAPVDTPLGTIYVMAYGTKLSYVIGSDKPGKLELPTDCYTWDNSAGSLEDFHAFDMSSSAICGVWVSGKMLVWVSDPLDSRWYCFVYRLVDGTLVSDRRARYRLGHPFFSEDMQDALSASKSMSPAIVVETGSWEAEEGQQQLVGTAGVDCVPFSDGKTLVVLGWAAASPAGAEVHTFQALWDHELGLLRALDRQDHLSSFSIAESVTWPVQLTIGTHQLNATDGPDRSLEVYPYRDRLVVAIVCAKEGLLLSATGVGHTGVDFTDSVQAVDLTEDGRVAFGGVLFVPLPMTLSPRWQPTFSQGMITIMTQGVNGSRAVELELGSSYARPSVLVEAEAGGAGLRIFSVDPLATGISASWETDANDVKFLTVASTAGTLTVGELPADELASHLSQSTVCSAAVVAAGAAEGGSAQLPVVWLHGDPNVQRPKSAGELKGPICLVRVNDSLSGEQWAVLVHSQSTSESLTATVAGPVGFPFDIAFDPSIGLPSTTGEMELQYAWSQDNLVSQCLAPDQVEVNAVPQGDDASNTMMTIFVGDIHITVQLQGSQVLVDNTAISGFTMGSLAPTLSSLSSTRLGIAPDKHDVLVADVLSTLGVSGNVVYSRSMGQLGGIVLTRRADSSLSARIFADLTGIDFHISHENESMTLQILSPVVLTTGPLAVADLRVDPRSPATATGRYGSPITPSSLHIGHGGLASSDVNLELGPQFSITMDLFMGPASFGASELARFGNKAAVELERSECGCPTLLLTTPEYEVRWHFPGEGLVFATLRKAAENRYVHPSNDAIRKSRVGFYPPSDRCVLFVSAEWSGTVHIESEELNLSQEGSGLWTFCLEVSETVPIWIRLNSGSAPGAPESIQIALLDLSSEGQDLSRAVDPVLPRWRSVGLSTTRTRSLRLDRPGRDRKLSGLCFPTQGPMDARQVTVGFHLGLDIRYEDLLGAMTPDREYLLCALMPTGEAESEMMRLVVVNRGGARLELYVHIRGSTKDSSRSVIGVCSPLIIPKEMLTGPLSLVVRLSSSDTERKVSIYTSPDQDRARQSLVQLPSTTGESPVAYQQLEGFGIREGKFVESSDHVYYRSMSSIDDVPTRYRYIVQSTTDNDNKWYYVDHSGDVSDGAESTAHSGAIADSKTLFGEASHIQTNATTLNGTPIDKCVVQRGDAVLWYERPSFVSSGKPSLVLTSTAGSQETFHAMEGLGILWPGFRIAYDYVFYQGENVEYDAEDVPKRRYLVRSTYSSYVENWYLVQSDATIGENSTYTHFVSAQRNHHVFTGVEIAPEANGSTNLGHSLGTLTLAVSSGTETRQSLPLQGPVETSAKGESKSAENDSSSNPLLCISGYDTRRAAKCRRLLDPMRPWDGEAASGEVLELPPGLYLHSFFVRSDEKSGVTLDFKLLEQGLSYADARALGVTPISVQSYDTVIIPNSVHRDDTIYNQVQLQAPKQPPGSKEDEPVDDRDILSNATLLRSGETADIVTVVPAPGFQNPSHSILVVNDSRVPVYSSSYKDPADAAPPETGIVLGGGGGDGSSTLLTNVGLIDACMSVAELTLDAMATGGWAKPRVAFYSAYWLDRALGQWTDPRNGGPELTIQAPISDSYPASKYSEHHAGGMDLFADPGAGAVYPAPVRSMYRIGLGMFNGRRVLIPSLRDAASLRMVSFEESFVDKAQRVFVTQRVGSAKLLGYIEGPPPVPSENMLFHADTEGDFQVQTTLHKTLTEGEMTGEHNWKNAGFTGSVEYGPSAKLSWSALVASIETSLSIKGHVNYSHAYKGLNSGPNFDGETNEVQVTQFTSLLSGAHELADVRQPGLDRPGVPRRYMCRNVGTLLASVEIYDEYETRFRGRVLHRGPGGDGEKKKLELVIPFPMNSDHRVIGCLDGVVGARAEDPSTPYVYPTVRKHLSLADYQRGKKGSYANLNEVPQLEKELEEELAGDGKMGYKNFKQSRSVGITYGHSVTGVETTHSSRTTMTRDDYYANIFRGGASLEYGSTTTFSSFAMSGLETGITLTASLEGEGGWEQSLTKSTFKRYDSRMDNEIEARYALTHHDRTLLNLELDESTEEPRDGGYLSLGPGDPGYLGLAPYDRAMVDSYRAAGEKTVGFRSDEGYYLGKIGPMGPELLPRPGEVIAYQFDTYVLHDSSDAKGKFFDQVADPVWLEEDPVGKQLAENKDETSKVDRVCHVVNYVERVLAPDPTDQDTRKPAAKRPPVLVEVLHHHPTSDPPPEVRPVPFSHFDPTIRTPGSLGAALALLAAHAEMRGLVTLDGVVVAALAPSVDTIVAELPAGVDLFALHAHERHWNQAGTSLVDNDWFQAGNPDTGMVAVTNDKLLKGCSASEEVDTWPLGSAWPLGAVPGSTELTSESLTKIVTYYFYQRQLRILQKFSNLQQLGRTGEAIPDPLELHGSSLYITAGALEIPAGAWWGIEIEGEGGQDYNRWIHYGAVGDGAGLTRGSRQIVELSEMTHLRDDVTYVAALYNGARASIGEATWPRFTLEHTLAPLDPYDPLDGELNKPGEIEIQRKSSVEYEFSVSNGSTIASISRPGNELVRFNPPVSSINTVDHRLRPGRYIITIGGGQKYHIHTRPI